ncbi:MAG: hypothetical protein ACK5JM_01010 [Rhodoblastus sp.]
MDQTQKSEASRKSGASELNETPRTREAPALARDAREPVSLKAALRRARLENAERGEAQDEVRGADVARLDLLREQLEPIFAQLPRDCDLFDLGLLQGDRPRLFVDMIAFVELTPDRRGFRFLQDTRNGRVLIEQSDASDAITQAVVDYLARRLIEREKALTAAVNPRTQPLGLADPAISRQNSAQKDLPSRHSAPADHGPPRARPGFLRWTARCFSLLFQALGAAVFFALLAMGGMWLWKTYF